MPIKSIVAVLALATLVAFSSRDQVQANAEFDSIRSIVTTGSTLRRAKYRVLTTGTVSSSATSAKPKDVFRAVFRGIQLQSGDQVSFTFEGLPTTLPDGSTMLTGRVDLGSPDFSGANAALTLNGRKGIGVLGELPYQWPKAKIRFNPRRQVLVFFSGKGRAQATPAVTPFGVSTNIPIDVTVHIRRTGEVDTDVIFTGQFRVRHNQNRRQQLEIYRGNVRNR